MINKHRNQTIIGLLGWFIPIAAVMLLALFQERIPAGSWLFNLGFDFWFFGGLGVGTLCFLWAGHHLAKGKGHSSRLVAFGLFPCFQPLVLTALIVLPDKNPPPRRREPPRSNEPPESVVARVVRHRRHAMVWNVFGLFFVLIGISMTLFPIGIFADFENESLCGFLIFGCGYCGVINGCRWWLKVKGWPEAIVFIGLTPLTICFIPYVWEVFVIEPMFLPLSMFLMTLILLVVILTLPDKSGMAGRNRRKPLRWSDHITATASAAKPAKNLATAKIVAATEPDLPALAELAGVIWRQHYPGIISSAQIDYMLAKMYSLDTLREELCDKNVSFFRLLVADRFVGFASIGPQPESGVMKLHKCYLLPEMHGRGYGSLLLKHCEQEARQRGAHRLILAVNKQNTKAVAAYRRNGFLVAESVITDFGNGFVMDDFIMAKSLRV
jgi:GNAT superfamily N-acetyltransferase